MPLNSSTALNQPIDYPNSSRQPWKTTAAGTGLDPVRVTRWHFVALCFYFVTQAYTIPVLPIGPWALWLGLPDLAVFGLVAVFLLTRQVGPPPTRVNRELTQFLLILCGLAAISFLLFRLLITLETGAVAADAGSRFGAYQLYRAGQFVVLFWSAAHIPLTRQRLTILRTITVSVLLLIFLGLLISYTQLLPASAFVPQLPNDRDVSGPWYIYYRYAELNLPAHFGTIGYNHAYLAAHVLILFAFYSYLRIAVVAAAPPGRPRQSPEGVRSSVGWSMLFGIVLLTIFLSESRAGLASILLLGVAYFLQRPAILLAGLTLGLLALLLVATGLWQLPTLSFFAPETITRSTTLLDPTDAENLSDRDTIWQERVAFLSADPTRWLVGVGFGNAVNSGANGHMLPLHIILETGVTGLVIYLLCFGYLMRALWRADVPTRPLFWATVALLFASVTQETFYPVTGQLHFLGLYLVIVAIGLGQRQPTEG